MAKFTTDLIVDGATFPGLCLARYAADVGMNVIVLEWSGHVGGMTTGGLGVGDWVSRTRWGRVKRFFEYIATHPPYNLPEGSEQKDFNSNEAIAAVNALLLDTSRITVVTKARIARVQMRVDDPSEIQYVELENGDTYWANYWGSGSYECDLPALTKRIRMRYGLDSANLFREKIENPDKNGLLTMPGYIPGHPVRYDGPANDVFGDRYHIATQPPRVGIQAGDGAPRAQAYGFRYSVRYKVARAPWPKPPNWRAADSDRIVDLVQRGAIDGGLFPFGLSPRQVSGTADGEPGLYSTNGGDLPGIWTNGWGNRSYAERDKVALRACYATMGANWTVANDPRLIGSRQNAIKDWGLPLDEFQDDYIGFPGHPPAYYVRDDRSIWGQYVMTTDDILENGDPSTGRFADSIALGGYNTDFHAFYKYPLPDGRAQIQGELGYTGIFRYSIPLRACLPHPEQCSNLVVCWGVSGSTIFRGSFRMEQTAGMCGQSLGMLVGLAWQRGVKIGAVPYSDLKEKMLADGALLQFP